MKAFLLTMLLSLNVSVAMAAEGDWSFFNKKDLAVDSDSDACPSGLFHFNQGKTTSLIRIGPRHTFEWHPKKTIERENPEGGCAYEFESQGDDHAVKVVTRRTKCGDKKLEGTNEESLTRQKDDSLVYLQEEADGSGKSLAKHRCVLHVANH